jgi:plastocyanin
MEVGGNARTRSWYVVAFSICTAAVSLLLAAGMSSALGSAGRRDTPVGLAGGPTLTPTATCVPGGGIVGVIIEGSNFISRYITITAGTTVRWSNYDAPGIDHTSTSDTGVWNSGVLTHGQSFDYAFNSPGTYPYHCAIHPAMTGTVAVLAGCSTATPTATPACAASWSIVSSPNVGANDNYLLGMAALSQNDAWASGYYFDGFASRTLIERWNGAAWSVVSSPNVGGSANVLPAIAAIASNDVWAVGYSGLQTLVQHWNGSQWSVVPSPNVGTGANALTGVAALAANDVWAVGHYHQPATNRYQTLVQHWNGAAWSVVSSPNVGTDSNFLWGGIAAVSPNNIWAVGSYGPNGSRRTLTMNWTGSKWLVIPSPNVGAGENRLNAALAIASNDIWAVGYAGSNPDEQALIEHWNGATWSVVPVPNLGPGQSMLLAMAASSSSDVWAAGFHDGATLTEHWNGSQWSVVPSPNQPGASYLQAMARSPDGSLWAGGSYLSGNVRRTLTMRFGTSGSSCPTWTPTNTRTATPTRTPTPLCGAAFQPALIADFQFIPRTMTIAPGTTVQWLNEGPSAHTSTSDTGVWDSGNLNPGQTYQYTFNTPGNYPYHCGTHPTMTGTITVLVGCLPSATPILTSTPTPMPSITATRTITPTGSPQHTRTPTTVPSASVTITSTPAMTGTRTRTPTPTAPPVPTSTPSPCAAGFVDVRPDEYFYEPVRQLACRGVVSGYADGTFRPYNNTTRGQLCKIVLLAFAYELYTPPAPTFSDVPAGHPFYTYVETAARESIVSGYADGTFRPGANATRGQICKIVVTAARWSTANPPAPTFDDVPPSHPFFLYIETAYTHGVISGYADGTFRAGNDATRGQICKIVYLASTTLIR